MKEMEQKKMYRKGEMYIYIYYTGSSTVLQRCCYTGAHLSL